jgi:peptidoglycan hydrolase-like protein with peptidoglycan-binding domain
MIRALFRPPGLSQALYGAFTHKEDKKMKKLLSVLLSIVFAFTVAVAMQNTNSSTTTGKPNAAKPRKPIFRATKDQIKQAQDILKGRGFYAGEQTGKLDDDTRAGLKKYQEAENMKVTGTLNKVTLEKMGVTLTDKQKTM